MVLISEDIRPVLAIRSDGALVARVVVEDGAFAVGVAVVAVDSRDKSDEAEMSSDGRVSDDEGAVWVVVGGRMSEGTGEEGGDERIDWEERVLNGYGGGAR